MPIHPRPRAETSKLLFPSVRFCMFSISSRFLKTRNARSLRSCLVLFVADLFHPVNSLAIELFLNGDMRHGGGWRSPVPVFLTRPEPDHVTRSNVLYRT